MVDSINFRTLKAEDIPSQRELFEACFPETLGTAHHGDGDSYRAWKFEGISATPPSREFIAEVDGHLTGYYAALPLEYRVQGKQARVALVVDVMVHPHSQGQGIFRRLGLFSCEQLKSEGFDFTTGYPIRPQVMPGHLKVGWQIAFAMPTYVSILSSKTILQSQNLGILYLFVEPFVKLQKWVINLILKMFGGPFRTETVASLSLLEDPNFWEFQSTWLARQTIALARTPATWKWRLSRPGSKYFSVLLRDHNGKIVGHALATPTVLKGVSTLAILDIQWTDIAAVPDIQRSLRQMAACFGCDTLSCMVSKSLFKRNGFFAAGFVKTGAVFKLIFNNLSRSIPDPVLLREENWHVTWLDTDDV